MSHIFPNSKPILLGAAEDSIGIIDDIAVAGLSGDVVIDDPTILFPRADTGTANLLVGPGTYSSAFFTVNYAKSINKAKLVAKIFTSFVGVNIIIELRRGGTTGDVLGSATNSGPVNNSKTITVIETNRPTGNQLYTVTCTIPSGQMFYTNYNGWSGDLEVVNVNDTHAAIITTPATATKQINSPDTHKTHETEVLP